MTRSPTPASELADLADCHPDTVRKYFNWFTDIGLATRSKDRPVTYQRNEAFFEWRAVMALVVDTSQEELDERIREIQDRLATYRRRYGASHPGEVNEDETDADDESPISSTNLAAWRRLTAELSLLERARRRMD